MVVAIEMRSPGAINLNIWSISTLDTVAFEENNRTLLRKVNFAFMIQNPSLDCSHVVLNFWLNLSPVALIKLFFMKKKACIIETAVFRQSVYARSLFSSI